MFESEPLLSFRRKVSSYTPQVFRHFKQPMSKCIPRKWPHPAGKPRMSLGGLGHSQWAVEAVFLRAEAK